MPRHFTQLKALICVGILFFSATLYAGEVTLRLKSTIDKVLEVISDPSNKGSKNTRKRRGLIRKILDESFDYKEMGKRSLGRRWKKLSDSEKKEFIDTFSVLLKTSYIKKIEGYKDEKIEYISETLKDDQYAICKTVIHTATNDIVINYKMTKKTSPSWKAYDVVIEGVSLVSNYRTQFKKLIRSRGYEKMIENMKAKIDEIDIEEST